MKITFQIRDNVVLARKRNRLLRVHDLLQLADHVIIDGKVLKNRRDGCIDLEALPLWKLLVDGEPLVGETDLGHPEG